MDELQRILLEYRNATDALTNKVITLKGIPQAMVVSREIPLALTKLQEASMWIDKALKVSGYKENAGAKPATPQPPAPTATTSSATPVAPVNNPSTVNNDASQATPSSTPLAPAVDANKSENQPSQ